MIFLEIGTEIPLLTYYRFTGEYHDKINDKKNNTNHYHISSGGVCGV
jgi:hypothetical protein